MEISYGVSRGVNEEKENPMRLAVELIGTELDTKRAPDSSLQISTSRVVKGFAALDPGLS
jgi:hypothetical protein